MHRDHTLSHVHVDYASFLASHDMTWDHIPHRWEVAPYTGNGMVGFLFYRSTDDARNQISIHVGRHDYYDHRLPFDGHECLWIYRCRLPLGRFNLESNGDVTGVDLRLDLWNAELTGTVTTTRGHYTVRGLTHSGCDVIYFELQEQDGESVRISWIPERPTSSVRERIKDGAGPQGPDWDKMREAPYPIPPEPTLSTDKTRQFCLQPLHDHRGQTTTGWEVMGDANGRQVLIASIHHSFPEKNSLEIASKNLLQARALLENGTFSSSHRDWWHTYYPQSFLTLSDAEKEAYYWIQLYKLGSSMRQDGPIQDVMGPWYHETMWPMVWGDLNVQLQYWTHLVSNRLDLGESLPNNLDKYAENLERNVPEHWQDSAALGPLFPQDCLSHDHGKVPDMLAWVLHNYWLHCSYAGDRQRMRNGLFPLLRKTVNGYLNYFKDNPVAADDGRLHIKNSWSPEYPGGHGQDINFSIALCRWACQTLLDLNAEHELIDPMVAEWQNVLDNLVGFQTDETGLRIGRDIAFEKPHRHYSHLLGFFPLGLITPEQPADRELLRTSLDHWLEVSSGVEKDEEGATAVCGYTATGAASMYAWLGDAEKAGHYLGFLIQHRLITPTTMYSEGNPCIETPFSFCTSIHDMLLQSWDGTIRVFPAVPESWENVAFDQFRTQGAFLVTAKRSEGVTQFVCLKSLTDSPCRIQPDIDNPDIYINGNTAAPGLVEVCTGGCYKIAMNKGDEILFVDSNQEHAELRIAAVSCADEQSHLFGFNAKTERLSGHKFYETKSEA